MALDLNEVQADALTLRRQIIDLTNQFKAKYKSLGVQIQVEDCGSIGSPGYQIVMTTLTVHGHGLTITVPGVGSRYPDGR